jgi:hypothetical protein
MVSMNSRIAPVCGSSTMQSVTSPTPRSASLPTDTSLEKPAPRPRPRDSNPPIMLPDCDTMARRPGLISSFSSTALTDSAHEGSLL